MVEETVIETVSDELDGDKTSKANEDILADIPDEEEEPKEKKEDKRSSAEIQKAKWREKFQAEKAERERLAKELEDARKPKVQDEDAESKARAYIRKEAREEMKLVLEEQKREEQKNVKEFRETLDEVLEDNPDVTEAKILDVIEEFEGEFKGMKTEAVFKAALKIIRKRESSDGEKPKMPKSKGGSEKIESVDKKSVDVSGKTMYQLAQEAIKKFKK